MILKKIAVFIMFFTVFFQIETNNKTESQTLKTTLTSFFENNIKNPLVRSYYTSTTAAHLFYQEKIKKNIQKKWGSFGKKTKNLLILFLFLSTYYGIHILCYPSEDQTENISILEQIGGGIATGTLDILLSIIATMISQRIDATIHPIIYHSTMY